LVPSTKKTQTHLASRVDGGELRVEGGERRARGSRRRVPSGGFRERLALLAPATRLTRRRQLRAERRDLGLGVLDGAPQRRLARVGVRQLALARPRLMMY